MSNGRWEFDKDGNVRYVGPDGKTQPGSYPPPPSGTASRQTTSSPSRRTTRKKDDDWHWVVIVLAFMVAWPIGLVLLFLELSGKWPGSSQVKKEFDRAASAAKDVAKQAQNKYSTRQTAERTAAPPPYTGPIAKTTAQKSKKKAKRDDGKAYGLGGIRAMRIVGWCMTGLFGFCSVMELVDGLTGFVSLGLLLENMIPLLAFTLIGVTLLWVAGGRSRKLKNFKKYLKLIGDKEEVSLSALAKTMGLRDKKVLQDVEEMLEREVLPEGYIDASRNCLVLREGGLAEEPIPVPREDLSQTDATLKHIRDLNDAIANREISDKIDHIEVLTAKIFRLLEDRPEKAGELRSFMNYYLPQTLKILENYAKLEAQGIEGDNIAEAKQKIEGMMDKLVDGYETQLDKLFADDVLDISADLKVMETMLAKDGLTMENDFQI